MIENALKRFTLMAKVMVIPYLTIDLHQKLNSPVNVVRKHPTKVDENELHKWKINFNFTNSLNYRRKKHNQNTSFSVDVRL